VVLVVEGCGGSDDVLNKTSSRHTSISCAGGGHAERRSDEYDERIAGGSRYGLPERCSLEHDERRLKSKLPTPVPSVKESKSFNRGAGGGWSHCAGKTE
jgi:hypothetical protein